MKLFYKIFIITFALSNFLFCSQKTNKVPIEVFLAVKSGDLSVLRKFIHENPKNVNARNEMGDTLLMMAEKENVIKFLLEQPEICSEIKIDGRELWRACDLSTLEGETGLKAQRKIKMLLTAGANVNLKDNLGITAIMRVCKNEPKEEVLDLLLSYGADIFEFNKEGESAFSILAQRYSQCRLYGNYEPFVHSANNYKNLILKYLSKDNYAYN